jgi:hypothetical protein
MRVLIPLFSPPTGTWGSLTRLMALARHFRDRGDSPAFCASGFVHRTLIEKGFASFETPGTTMLGLPRPVSDLLLARSQRMAPPVKEGRDLGNVWLLYFFTGLAKTSYLRRLAAAEMRAVRAFKPDLLLTEMDPGAYLVARLTGLPLVTTYASVARLGIGSFFWRKVRKAMNDVLRRHGVKVDSNPEDLAFGAGVLKLIPSIPELDGTDPSRGDVCYTGNLLEPVQAAGARFLPEPGKLYVFCYFGTGSVSLDRAERVLPRVFNENSDAICLVAAQSVKRDFAVGNVRFTSYVPARDLLPHCFATMCHGGLNTVTQSLEAGVPLLVFPGAIFERRANARSVERAGGGFMGERSDFNPAWIKDKLARIDALSGSVRSLRAAFRRYRGPAEAYERIKRWLERAKALPETAGRV